MQVPDAQRSFGRAVRGPHHQQPRMPLLRAATHNASKAAGGLPTSTQTRSTIPLPSTPVAPKKRGRDESDPGEEMDTRIKKARTSPVQLPSPPESPPKHLDSTVRKFQDAALHSAMPSTHFVPQTMIGATQITTSSAPAKPPTPENNPTPTRQGPSGLHRDRAWQAHEFRAGMIISAPYHATALKQGADPQSDDNFVQSKAAMICSKRRMYVVCWAYEDDFIFTLPISSHTHNSLRYVPESQRKYHICLKDRNDNQFYHEYQENYPAEVAHMYYEAMGRHSSINLLESRTIHMREDIKVVGYLDGRSRDYVIDRYHEERRRAERYSR